MTAEAAVLQLHQRDAFERNVARALIAGGAAGVVTYAAHRLGAALPLAYAVAAATSLACVRGDRVDRILLAGLSLVAPAAPWFLGLPATWETALAGAAAGALMVRSRLCDRGEEGAVASARPGPLNYLLSAAACAALALAGAQVAEVFRLRLLGGAAPALIAYALSASAFALFVCLGSIGAHLALRPDPVEVRCEELIPQLRGELQDLARRALALYRQCGAALALLPRQPAREELARTLSQMTQQAVELASEWAGVELQLDQGGQKELEAKARELEASARSSRDPIARQQLELAAQALREELSNVDQLQLRRERILAKLKVQVAILERARVALIGLRSGHAQLRSAELTAIAQKLASLSRLQHDEAQLADAVATGSELPVDEGRTRMSDGQRVGSA